MKKKNLSDDTLIFIIGLLLFFFLAIYKLLNVFFAINIASILPACYIRQATGFPCISCGATRAFTTLINGDILNSLRYNPVIAYFFVLYIPYMISNLIAVIWNYFDKKKSKLSYSQSKTASLLYPHKGMQFKVVYVYCGLILAFVFWIFQIVNTIKA